MTQQQISPTTPLSGPPSHSAEHTRLSTQVASMGLQLNGADGKSGIAGENGTLAQMTKDIDQARLVANTWIVPGPVASNANPLLPLIWNLTERAVLYQAAVISVLTPPQGSEIRVDIVSGVDLSTSSWTSILSAPLVISPGQYRSEVYLRADGKFGADQPIGSWVAPVIIGQGTDPDFGRDLTIQLNRSL